MLRVNSVWIESEGDKADEIIVVSAPDKDGKVEIKQPAKLNAIVKVNAEDLLSALKTFSKQQKERE